MHGIKVLMAKNYIDNLSETARTEFTAAHPRPEQLARMAMSMLGRDRVEAVDLDPEDRISFPGVHRMIAHLALASLQEDSEARQGDLLQARHARFALAIECLLGTG